MIVNTTTIKSSDLVNFRCSGCGNVLYWDWGYNDAQNSLGGTIYDAFCGDCEIDYEVKPAEFMIEERRY